MENTRNFAKYNNVDNNNKTQHLLYLKATLLTDVYIQILPTI